MNDENISKKLHKAITSDGRVRVELVPLPSSDNPWRTRQEYIDEQKRDAWRFWVTIGTLVVSLVGVVSTTVIGILTIKDVAAHAKSIKEGISPVKSVFEPIVDLVPAVLSNLDWANALLGAFLGLMLVFIVDLIRSPKVHIKGFERVTTGQGHVLFKIKFNLWGFRDPGVSCVEIVNNNDVRLAKWDEKSEPLKEDTFVAEKVPETYYQQLYCWKIYSVPILIKTKEAIEIFDAWWYGKNDGYKTSAVVDEKQKISLIIRGANFSKKKNYAVKKIIDKCK